jgi:hypothetical protein
MPNFTLNSNAFKKCAPAISTNIKQCGSVTQCNAIPLEEGDLSTTFMSSGDFKVMEALLFHDMEIKMCEQVQNGMYDFLMANKVNLSRRVTTTRLNSGLTQIAPFVLARQYSPINNEYWIGDQGYSDLTTQTATFPYNWPAAVKTYLGNNDTNSTWYLRVKSASNIPVDASGTYPARSFPPGLRIYIDGKTPGGASTKTAWEVESSIAYTMGGVDYVFLALIPQNAGSNLDIDRIVPSPGNALYADKALIRRGTPNVNDFEKWCNESPAYLNWKNVPFWVETTRTSLCKSSLYDKWRKLVMLDNPLYKEFFDLDEISKNRQLANDFQRRWVNSFFWNKAISANQTLGLYNDLADIETFDGTTMGVDGGRCIGKRANAVGAYEQLAECGRVYDALGQKLNLGALFRELYNIMRVRENNGTASSTSIDIFTSTPEAELINQAMITYYSNKSQGLLRMTYAVDRGEVKTAVFGFKFRSYTLFWPAVTINIITHHFFDDYLSGASAAGQESTARVLWILDFAGIYPGILASKRVVQQTGDLKTLAAVNPDFACVMEVPTQEQTLTSLTWTVVVECPAANLIIENFNDLVPDATDNPAIDYSAGASFSTVSTTP